MSSLTDPLGPDLTATLRALKLGKLTATLPERLTLARQTDMPHADFLQLILSDEVTRREAGSIALRARNAAGPGPEDLLNAANTPPAAPTGLAVTRAGGTVTVTFVPPDDETVTGYQVSLDDGATWAGLDPSGVVTGLDNASTYTIRVRAVNDAGPGRPSDPVTTDPATLPAPGAPQQVTATGRVSSILVTWAPPADSPVPVTGYRAVASPGPAVCTAGPSATSCVLGGTAGVRYRVYVVALSAAGPSTTSTTSATATS